MDSIKVISNKGTLMASRLNSVSSMGSWVVWVTWVRRFVGGEGGVGQKSGMGKGLAI